jgi:hypothetical protein
MRDSEKNLTHLQRVLLFKDSRGTPDAATEKIGFKKTGKRVQGRSPAL